MYRVRLDQNQWIALGWAANDNPRGDRYRDVLDFLRYGVAHGLVSLPLTLDHYIDTFRRGDVGSRQRLGAIMAELSRGHHMAPSTDVVRYETAMAVDQFLGPRLGAHPAPVFGTGFRHAFGQATSDLLSPEAEARLDLMVASGVPRQDIDAYFDTHMIVGPDFALPAHGIARPDRTHAENYAASQNERLEKFVAAGNFAPDRCRRAATAYAFIDLLDWFEPILGVAGLSLDDVISRGGAFMRDFLRAVPTAYTVACLEEVALRKQRRWKVNDMSDVLQLAYGATYCDVVVGEKAWTNLLRESAATPRAVLLTDLTELPGLIAAAE